MRGAGRTFGTFSISKTTMPGRVKVIKLEQNYRSSKTILQIAGKLIAQNLQRKDKELWTENAQGEPAKMLNCQDEHDEAEQVVQRFIALHELKDEHGQHRYDWGKMAIFYRMNSLSRVVEDALRKNAIPYQIARGTEFYNRKEIKDTLAYLRVIANPRDEVGLDRIANTPTRGISDATLKQLSAWGIANGGGLWEAMQRVAENKDLNARAQAAVTKFVNQIESWQADCGYAQESVASSADEMFGDFSPDASATAPIHANVRATLERVVRESGLEAMYRKLDPDQEEQVANINELISSAAEFDAGNPEGTLSEYLAGIALVADADHMEGAGGAVTMMTLHAAKGLEFPVVAMVGLEEGILPHSRARGNIDELEEERRLCFVGITRAQEHLILSKAARRTMRGISERSIPSPFIAEMPAEALEVIDRTGLDFPLPGRDLVSSYVNPAKAGVSKFKPGTLVRHPSFGVGKIFDVSDIGQQTRAVVDFSRAGRKTLILEYARLEVVS